MRAVGLLFQQCHTMSYVELPTQLRGEAEWRRVNDPTADAAVPPHGH